MKPTKQTDTHTCDWCRKSGVKKKAAWRSHGFSTQYACEHHKGSIHKDDGHLTEADYQTWYRL